MRAAGDGEAANQLIRRAAESGYAAAKLAYALSLLIKDSPEDRTAAEAEAEGWPEAASSDGSAEALNVLGLMRWHKASNDEQRGVALRLLQQSAEKGSPLAHENLAIVLGFWPEEPAARTRGLYHLLVAARLQAHIGNADRARQLLITSQVLTRSLRHDAAAAASRRYGLRRVEVDRLYDAIVDYAEIGSFIDEPIKNYSSGMAMRLGFAIVAHLDPDILLLDEIFAVGDADFQEKCTKTMREFVARGKTILFVSHSAEAIRQMCSRVCVLSHGHVVFDGDVAQGLETYDAIIAAEHTPVRSR